MVESVVLIRYEKVIWGVFLGLWKKESVDERRVEFLEVVREVVLSSLLDLRFFLLEEEEESK